MSYWNGRHWVSEPSETTAAPKRSRRFLGASLEAGLIVLLTFGLIAGTALAAAGENGNGKGGRASESTLSLVVLAPPDVNYGEQITFAVQTNATDQPHVSVRCYQAGTLLYSSSAGFYDGYPWPTNQIFTLSSRAWTAGAAECTAELAYWDGRRFRTLVALAFTAQG